MPRPLSARATAFLATLITTVAASSPAAHAAAVGIVVSIPPLKGLAEPLVAAAADPAKGETPPAVVALIPPGKSEHGYEIPPSKLAALTDADVVVIVGLGLEPGVEKFLADRPASTPGRARRVVRFADVAGIKPDPHAGHDHAHDGDDDHDHDHGATDPHLWLDPVLVASLVDSLTASIADAAADPAAAARVRDAGRALKARVQRLDQDYRTQTATFTSKTIIVGHDAWGRLADRYGLKTVAIAGLTAGEPTPAALERARQTVLEQTRKVIFVEPQLSDRAGRRIAEATGAEVRRLDPLGEGDWFGLMEQNLRELARALAPPPPQPPASSPSGATPAPTPAEPAKR